MESPESGQIEAALTHRFEERTQADEIAKALVSIWQEIDDVLRPILGQRGVAALYQRSLYLTRRLHSWLECPHETPQITIDFTHLETVLAHQHRVTTIAGAACLLQTFYNLLITLIGLSLTERLLRSVGNHLFSSPPAQDSP